jgi:transposase
MAGSRLITLSEGERAMKIQEVVLKAMSGELKWYQAAQIIGISDRQMRRWRGRYQHHGYGGLFDRRKEIPSPRRIPFDTAQEVLRLYREEYFDFNVRHFHEELRDKQRILVSYTWVKLLLQESGLVGKEKKRGRYRRRRERRVLPGMLLHLDGSSHHWFDHREDDLQTLLSVIDDASSECLAAKFVPEEATRPILEILKEIVSTRGTFISLYTDRAAHFVYTPKAGAAPDRSHKTQVEQVLDELGIELIVAYSPEARGRGERAFGTMQGRLVPELRRAGVSTYEDANRYLRDVFIPRYNKLFRVDAKESGTAFIPVVGADLNRIFSLRHERTVYRDNTVHFENRVLQLPRVEGVSTLAKRKVQIRENLDGTLDVLSGKRLIASFSPERIGDEAHTLRKVANS